MMKFPKHINLTLEHNPHAIYYETVEYHCISEGYICEDWVSLEEREKAHKTNELWTIQWYPDTPIGFFFLAASTLEALLDALEKIDES